MRLAHRTVTFALTVVLTLLAGAAHAGYSRGGGFRSPGYGARQWGMAGAAIADFADEGAVYWNPALMSLVGAQRVGVSYGGLIEGTDAQQAYLAYTLPLKRGPENEPGMAFSYHSVGFLFTNTSLELSDGQGYSESTFRIAYALAPQYFVAIGAAFNFHVSSSDVNGFDATGTSMDIGLRVAMFKRMNVALVVRNALSQIDYEDSSNFSLERTITLGASYHLWQFLTMEGDAEAAFGAIANLRLGGEASLFRRLLFLRLGVAAKTAGETRTVLHAGLGVRVGSLHLDYNADLDDAEAFDERQRLSLAFQF